MLLKRDLYFDSMKCVLIMFVIIGHTLESFGSIETNRLALTTYFSIYTFHMPLFVFISGYFTSNNRLKTFESIIRILLIFVVFQFIRLLLSGEWSFANIITPQWTLWYLLSLLFWKFGVLLLPSQLSKGKTVFVIFSSFLLSFFANFIPLELELSFQRTFNFFPFFLLGYYAKNTGLVRYIRKLNHYIPIFIVITVCCVIFIGNKPLYPLLMFQSRSWIGCGLFEQLSWKVFFMAICVLMSVSIMNLIPSFHIRLAYYGRFTLRFYLLHTFLIDFLKVINLPVGYIYSLIYALFIILILLLITKIKTFDNFLRRVQL